MTGTSQEKENALVKLVQRFAPSSLDPSNAGGEATSRDAAATQDVEMDDAPQRQPSAFDCADDLERGLAAEAVMAKNATSPAGAREPFRRCCIFHLDTPAGRSADEYHLLSETGDMLMVAKFFRGRLLEFYLPNDEETSKSSPSSSSKTPRPVFAMTYSENNDNWVLKQTSCEHCVQRPKHLSCDFLGKAQQVAFIQHSRKKVNKALVHNVQVRIPALVDDTESMVWCPVTLGRDLSDRSPANLSDRSPSTPKRCRSSNSLGKDRFRLAQHEDEEEEPLRLSTKLPAWDEVVKCLVLNFKDRTVEACPMNFMLCVETDTSQKLVLQHAKLSKNTYCLDFRYPLSTIQAFAIAMTALLWD